jgi:hypothetical protein
MHNFFENQLKKANKLIEDYSMFIAVNRSLNEFCKCKKIRNSIDIDEIKKHLNDIVDKLSTLQKETLYENIHKKESIVAMQMERINNDNNEQYFENVAEQYCKILKLNLDNFPINDIVSAISLIKPQEVYSSDCPKDYYNEIKPTLKIEKVKIFVVALKELLKIRAQQRK